MTSFEVRDVKNFLKNRFIASSSEWIEACIAFIKQEHSGENLSLNALKDNVYNQWLSADLEEIGVSSLPQELPSLQKTTLNGSFALQVNFIRDVGRPAYAQLNDLNRLQNSNAEFSAAPPPTVPPWEAKPTRMLMLSLTDGCTTVQGMEYRPINSLSLNLPPGSKVLIQGPIDCRFGVILLTPEKIKVLGGEVESKLEQFSQQALLREMLNLPPLEEQASEAENTGSINHVQQANDIEHDDEVSIIAENIITAPQRPIESSRPNNPGHRTNERTQSRIATGRQNGGGSNTLRNYFSSQNQGGGQSQDISDDLDSFENEDDDFVQNLNYAAIDELEKENSLTQSGSFEEADNVWQEDEDVLQDMMAFQDENPGLVEIPDEGQSRTSQTAVQQNLPVIYLSSIANQPVSNRTVTIKGFIIQVLSKLECTVDGWSLFVKVNDGTSTLDANIHDKVLESIIGVSAVDVLKMQKIAAQNQEKKKEVLEAIAKCRSTLKDYNCLIDIQFSPNSKPCIVKFHPVTQLHMKQLMERVRS